MIEDRVRQSLFEPAWGSYRNAHFSVPKKNEMYCIVVSAMCVIWHAMEYVGIRPNVEALSEAFTGLPIPSQMDLHSGYKPTHVAQE
jgi:hypothetical protein